MLYYLKGQINSNHISMSEFEEFKPNIFVVYNQVVLPSVHTHIILSRTQSALTLRHLNLL